MATYPGREPYFAHRLVRLMLRVCAAQEIGSGGVLLVACIVHTEDAKRYRDAVTYWNEQLIPMLGLNSWKQLERLRSKCVKAGWLHYERQSKRHVGKYWSLIPAKFDGMGDSDTSCDAALLVKNDQRTENERENERLMNGGMNGRMNGESKGESSSLLTNPIPSSGTGTGSRSEPKLRLASEVDVPGINSKALAAIQIRPLPATSIRNGQATKALPPSLDDRQGVVRWWREHLSSDAPLTGPTLLDLLLVLCCLLECQRSGRSVANKVGLFAHRLVSGEWLDAKTDAERIYIWLRGEVMAGRIETLEPVEVST